MKDRKAMFGKRMGAAAMLFLLLTVAAGSRAEAGWLSQTLERLRNEGFDLDVKIDRDDIPRRILDDSAAAENEKRREELEGAKAEYVDANYGNDINLVVMRNSADEIVYIGSAILMRMYNGNSFAAVTRGIDDTATCELNELYIGSNYVAAIMAAFDEEVASAVVGGIYELDISTLDLGVAEDNVMCSLKEPLPENEGAFLYMAYARPIENATMVYYDEEFDLHADTVTLTVSDDEEIFIDHLPENIQYPAALVNADNALIGLVGKYAEGERYITVFRETEEGKAAVGDAAGDTTGDAAGDTTGDAAGDVAGGTAGDAAESAAGDAAGDAPEGAPENWDQDLEFVVVNDSEGNPLHAGTAVVLRSDPATVFSQTFDEGFVSAYLTTGVRTYDLNTDSMESIGNGSSYWTIKDPLPDDDPSFLDSGYAHQNESATIVYYAKKKGELVPCAETVTLMECSENGRLTADHSPEDMTIYPAVLVNADNECIGIIHAGGIIVGGTDPETFYGDAPAASEGAAEGAQEGTAGSAGETPAANPAVSVEPEEAVHPAVILGEEIGKMVNTSAVQLDGDTYVLTSTDTIADFDYEAHSMSILPEDLPENNDVQIRVLPLIMEEGENNLQIVALIGFKQQDNVIGSLPVADAINPEHQLGYVFSYVSPDDSESENMYDHVWQDYILHYSPLRDNLYLIEDEIEYQDNLLGGWPGALIYDVVTHEAVGIGTYVDGKYAFEDITTDMRAALDEEPSLKELLPMKGWGALAKAAEGE